MGNHFTQKMKTESLKARVIDAPESEDVVILCLRKDTWNILWGWACRDGFSVQGGYMTIGNIISRPLEKVLRSAYKASPDHSKWEERYRLTLRQFIELQTKLANIGLKPWGEIYEDTTPPSALEKARAEIEVLRSQLVQN